MKYLAIHEMDGLEGLSGREGEGAWMAKDGDDGKVSVRGWEMVYAEGF